MKNAGCSLSLRSEDLFLWFDLDYSLSVGQGEPEKNTALASSLCRVLLLLQLGKPSIKKSVVFLNIVQKAFDPPPLLFEHLSYFAGGVF